MLLHELKKSKGARKRRKIVGRGPGSGSGKTSGRGHKGQKSRSGRAIIHGLEGGQMPLIRRLPKFGFRSKNPVVYQIINVKDLSSLKEGTQVDLNFMKSQGLIKSTRKLVKVLGSGELNKKFHIKAHCFSESAKKKILDAGGKVEAIQK